MSSSGNGASSNSSSSSSSSRTRLVFSKNSIVLLILIGVVALLLSLISFQYANSTANQIIKLAADDIRLNAQIQVHDLNRIMINKINDVATNLQIIAEAPALQSGDFDGARGLFDTAQNSTKELTNFYMWLDRNGRLVWLSNLNQTAYERFKGTDLSHRPYFVNARANLQTYYSTVIDSNDNVLRIYVSHPIVNRENGEFNGIVAAGIRLDVLGKSLQEELSPELLSPEFQSMVGMVDRSGVVLYARNQTLIGKYVFGDEVQSLIPSEIKDSFNSFLRRSLAGSSGVEDVSFASRTLSIAYQPIIFGDEQFGTLYIITPHERAHSVGPLVEQQKNLSIMIVTAIAAIAIGTGVLIMTWNRKLEQTVNARTLELRAKSEELKRSYDSLAAANEQLKVHDRMQKEFINVAAHELRTPTQAILGYAELLQMNPEDRGEMIRAIYRNSVRLQRLTSDILDVTRIESDSLKLSKEKFNIKDVVEAAIQDARNQVPNGQIKFVYEASNNNIFVNADRGRIMQVLSNLLDNAVKFTKEGKITVTAETKNDHAIIKVSDTGTGIDGEIMPRLFSKFASKSDKGTGLGLYISRSIIEAHDGRIWCGNNSDGRGATFAFSLPVAEVPSSPTIQPANQQPTMP